MKISRRNIFGFLPEIGHIDDAPLSYMMHYAAKLRSSFPKFKAKQKIFPDQKNRKAENEKSLLINEWTGKIESFELINVAI